MRACFPVIFDIFTTFYTVITCYFNQRFAIIKTEPVIIGNISVAVRADPVEV